MKLLEMSELNLTRLETSGRIETAPRQQSRRERPLSALPDQTLSERIEEVREGIRRVILAIWTAKA